MNKIIFALLPVGLFIVGIFIGAIAFSNTEIREVNKTIEKVIVKECPVLSAEDGVRYAELCSQILYNTTNQVSQSSYTLGKNSVSCGGGGGSGHGFSNSNALQGITPVYSACDLNKDESVNYLDLGIWATCQEYYDKEYSGECDLNKDGMLNYLDLGAWSNCAGEYA